MKVIKTQRRKRRSLREIVGDRALMAGLLFSVVVHIVVVFSLRWPAKDPAESPQRLMVARLVRLPAPPPASMEAALVAAPELAPIEEEPPPPPARKKAEKEAPAAEAPEAEDPEAEDPEAETPKAETPKAGEEEEGIITAAARGTRDVPGARAEGAVSLAINPAAAKVEAMRPPPRPAVGRGRMKIALAPAPVPARSAARALTEIRRMIDAQKSYPRLAMRNGWEGEVLVEIRLSGGGSLEDVQIVGASGYGILDNATLKAVRRAGPFPPLEGKVRVPVTYRLQRP